MSLVKFYRGPKNMYNPLIHIDGLYFSLDTQEIFLDGKSYGYNPTDHQEISKVDYIEPDTIELTYTNGSKDSIRLQTAVGSSSEEESSGGLLSKEYASKLANLDSTISTAVGTAEKYTDNKISELSEVVSNKASQEDLQKEITRAQQAETELGTKIENNSTQLTQEISNREEAVSTLQNKITAEETRATQKENELSGKITSLENTKQNNLTAGKGLEIKDDTINITLDHTLFKVVDILPNTPAEEDKNKIFLVSSTNTEEDNVYKEYIYAETKWEKLGEFKPEVDLTPYLKKTDLTASVSTTGLAISKDAGTGKLVEIGFSEDLPGTVSGTKVTIALKDILTASIASGMYKVAIDKKGRITGTAAITLDDLTNLGVATKSEVESVKSDLEELSTAQAEDLSKITNLENKLNGIDNVKEELDKKANTDSVYDKDYIDSNLLTATQSDAKYQPIGDYATHEDLNSFETEVDERLTADEEKINQLEQTKADIEDLSNVISEDSSDDVFDDYKSTTIETISATNNNATIDAKTGMYYNIAGVVNTLKLTLPDIVDKEHIKSISVMFTTGDTPAVTISGKADIAYFSGYSIEPNTTYEINLMFNGTKWIVAYGIVE